MIINILPPIAQTALTPIASAASLISKVIGYLNCPLLSGVRLNVVSYQENLESKVSTQMLVDFNYNKQIIADNIAPMPRTWNIKAYIGTALIGFPMNTQAQPGPSSIDATLNLNPTTFAFLLLAASLAIPIQIIEPTLYWMPTLKQQYQVLQNAWKNLKLVWFRDKYGVFIPVAIEKMVFDSDPTVQNMIPVTITLREFITYNNNQSALVPTDPTNQASSSTNFGASIIHGVGLL